MARVQSEYKLETQYINKLEELGYEYVELKDYPAVLENFRIQFCKLNRKALIDAKGKATLSDKEFDRILLRLENKTIYESAKILREKWVLELDNGKKIYVEFFSANQSRNTYQVSHQITMSPEHKDDVVYVNRYDVTILMNGIPVVQTELKKQGVDIYEAVNQINRYRRFSFTGLFRYIQIFVVSNSTVTKYFANNNENDAFGNKQDLLKSLVFYWTDENNKRITKLMDFSDDFLDRFRLTEMLDKYFIIKESEPLLMVMRPYQIYATKRAYDRVMNANKNGFIFHTTGSGKTLTSYRLATLLRDDHRIAKVFFLIDRTDLDDQTVDEYNSFEEGCVDSTDNTSQLIKSLKDTSKKLIITTIQKMTKALKTERYASVLDGFKDEKCVFIIDECHRSQFGIMHTMIRNHFKKANFIGFTGTPIFNENREAGYTTADLFSAAPLESCIHRYMIKEAIADGNVLPFSVEFLVGKARNKINTTDSEGQYLTEEEYCRQNNIRPDDFFHSDERIAGISDSILDQLAQHTRLESNHIYTALFAVDKVDALMKYYHYMKEHNPFGYKIAAIFTYAANQDFESGSGEYHGDYLKECIDDYNQMFGTSFSLDEFAAYRRDISFSDIMYTGKIILKDGSK